MINALALVFLASGILSGIFQYDGYVMGIVRTEITLKNAIAEKITQSK